MQNRGRFAWLSWPLLGSLTLLSTGCLHRTPWRSAIAVTGAPQYLTVAPVTPHTSLSADWQQTALRLPATPPSAAHDPACSVSGPVFSLFPPKAADPNLWQVTSPTVQGWEQHDTPIDTGAEWDRFSRQLQSLLRHGCFPARDTLDFVRTAIAQAIPLPADQLLARKAKRATL